MTHAARVVATLGALATLVACQSIIGAEFDDVTTLECKLAGPPARLPPSGGDNAEPTSDILIALTSIEVGDDPALQAYKTIGFDLDGTCTGLGHKPSCRSFAWTHPDPTDGIGGIDNNSGALMRAQDEVFNLRPFTSVTVTEKIARGVGTPVAIVRIRGWNRVFSDDHVEVDWYLAAPLGKPIAAATDDAGAAIPWPISDRTFAEGSPPWTPGTPYPPSRYRDGDAYVNEYTVVARLPPGTPLSLVNARFASEGILATFKVDFGPPPFVTEATIGSRVRTKELFRKLPKLLEVFSVNDFCKGNRIYDRVKYYFCGFMDIHADGRFDPNADCDAMSLGMRLRATPVSQGALTPEPDEKKCAPELDPGDDTCAIPVTPGPL